MRRIRCFICGFITVLQILCLGGCGDSQADLSGISDTLPMEEEQTENIQTEDIQSENSNQQSQTGTIYVHVCGQVQSPGVYALEAGSRVYEAIEAAGGMTQAAAFSYLNQAEAVSDGQQIYVPREDEVRPPTGQAADPASQAGNLPGDSSAHAEDGKVNLNTASLEELKLLNGIGEVKAKAILQYREEHGGFRTIEELMEVDGMGEGTFRKLKDQIKI